MTIEGTNKLKQQRIERSMGTRNQSLWKIVTKRIGFKIKAMQLALRDTAMLNWLGSVYLDMKSAKGDCDACKRRWECG